MVANDGTFTEEQIEYIRKNFPDLVGAGQDMQRQMALADQLRVRAPTQRMDWASQAARGIQGTFAGHQDYLRDKTQKETRGANRIFWENFPGAPLVGAPPPQFNMYGPGGSRPTITDEERLSMYQP